MTRGTVPLVRTKGTVPLVRFEMSIDMQVYKL